MNLTLISLLYSRLWLMVMIQLVNYCIFMLIFISDLLQPGRDEDIKDAVRYILFIGSILSLLCLSVALFIFYYFK